MDSVMAGLRISHIFFGVFWAGTYLFATLILIPRLRALGPAIERPVFREVLKVATPIMVVSSFIVLGTGIAMALRVWGWHLDDMLATGWGKAMLVALIATVAAIAGGLAFLMPSGLRMDKINRAIQGREPTPEEDHELDRLSTRIVKMDRIIFLLVLTALIAMPVSRFV